MTMNTNKKNWMNAKVFARNGKAALVFFNKTDSVVKPFTQDAPTQNIAMVAAYNLMSFAINEAIKTGENLRIYGPSDCYGLASKTFVELKAGDYDAIQSNVTEFTANREKYTQEETDAYIAARQLFVDTLVEAKKQGIVVVVNPLSYYGTHILDVPAGVELKGGEKLIFKNGKTAEGISMKDWTNFSNYVGLEVMKAVSSRTDKVYFYVRTAKSALDKKVDQLLYGACPAAEKEVTVEATVQVA